MKRVLSRATLLLLPVLALAAPPDIPMMEIPAGSVQIGISGDTKNPPTLHTVSNRFWMSKTEITQSQYLAMVGTNPSSIQSTNHPVETVSWFEALAFCDALTTRERTAGRLPEGLVYRLPTSAEWEYAARGGPASSNTTFAGSNDENLVSWNRTNAQAHQPVGLKLPNELGLYDMTGNVWEWCIDALPPERTGKKGQDTRVKRGGSYNNSGPTSSIANIGEMNTDAKGPRYGFRIVLAPPFSAH